MKDPSDKFINLIVFIAIVVGFAPTLIAYFTNLSGSGLVLASVIASLFGLLLGVFVLKSGIALLRGK